MGANWANEVDWRQMQKIMGGIVNGIALADGMFDPYHPGHAQYLSKAELNAQALGMELHVRVASDDQVRLKHEPLLPQADRAALVDAYADDVIATEETTAQVLQRIKPNIYVKGADWRGRLPHREVDICQKINCAIDYTDTVINSSTKFLNDWRQRTDAAALDKLETLIQTQQAPRPQDFDEGYYERQGFTAEQRRVIEGPHAAIARQVFDRVRTVLDFGCGPGFFMDQLKEAGFPEVTGYDPSPTAKGVKTLLDLAGRNFSLVICREVLEHMTVREIARTVTELCERSDKYVYCTTRFHQSPDSLLSVSDDLDIDPTHISCLDQTFLRTLFVLQGFTRCRGLEQRLDHRNKHRVLVYERQR